MAAYEAKVLVKRQPQGHGDGAKHEVDDAGALHVGAVIEIQHQQRGPHEGDAGNHRLKEAGLAGDPVQAMAGQIGQQGQGDGEMGRVQDGAHRLSHCIRWAVIKNAIRVPSVSARVMPRACSMSNAPSVTMPAPAGI